MKRLLASALCALAPHAAAAAHVLDEYVQAAQISLAHGGARVELRLVPGVEVAERVYALIDTDGDGQVSTEEEQAYARRVLRDVALEVDGRPAPLALGGIELPSRREMSEGVGAIRLDLAAEADLNGAGAHSLSFRNDHLPELGVYLANALVPTTERIKITAQRRDVLQRGLQVDFLVLAGGARVWPRRIGLLLSACGLTLLLARGKLRRVLFAPRPK